MHFVAKATPSHNINGKCHIKKTESRRIQLTGYIFQVHFMRVVRNTVLMITTADIHKLKEFSMDNV